MSFKIVVLGDINGHIKDVFTKLGKLHEKQNFSFAIIAGDLFSDESTKTEDSDESEVAKLLKGEIEIPLQIYFSPGKKAFPTAVTDKLRDGTGEVCTNLSILGRKVSMKTSEGVQIAAVCGSHHGSGADQMQVDSTSTSFYTDQDVESAKAFPQPHILITSDWPAGITNRSGKPYKNAERTEIQSLSDLCVALKPRYHFSTSELFYEREPFSHSRQSHDQVTRFISLAPFANPSSKEKKWIYAFSLNLEAAPQAEVLTESPFTGSKRQNLQSRAEEVDNFRFTHSNGHNNSPQDHHRRRKRRRPGPYQEPGNCFFCMAADSFEKHMVVSVGEHSYVTIAKGPLSNNKTFPALAGMPAHILIIPVVHAATLSRITEDSTAVREEMAKFREALQTMVAAKSTSGDSGAASLGAVTWEISRADGVHLHWQFLPVPAEKIKAGIVEAAFDVEAENLGYPRFVKEAAGVAEIIGNDDDGKSSNGSGGEDYFRVMIWTEDGGRKEMVLPLSSSDDENFRFNLQFGRQVMAKLLGLESRMNWRDCAQAEAEESADRTKLAEAFGQYDPA